MKRTNKMQIEKIVKQAIKQCNLVLKKEAFLFKKSQSSYEDFTITNAAGMPVAYVEMNAFSIEVGTRLAAVNVVIKNENDLSAILVGLMIKHIASHLDREAFAPVGARGKILQR